MIRLPRLARHSALYIAAPVFQRALYFLMVPLFTRYLTPAEYGAWGYVTVAATLVGTLAPLGLQSAYNYALRRPSAWTHPGPQILRAAFKTALLLLIVFCLAAFLILRQVPLGFDADGLWLIVLVATVVGYVAQVAKRREQMLEHPRRYVQIELGFGMAVAAGSYLGVVHLHLGVMGLALGLLVAAGVGFLLSWPLVRHDLSGPVDPGARREALAFGLPLFVHTGAAVLLQYLDRFMLERLSSLHELGLYSLAGQIGTAMLVITTSTNQAYLPFLYRRLDHRFELVAQAQRYVGGFFVAVGLVGIASTPFVIRLFIDPRYLEAILPAQLLVAAGVFHGWYFLVVGRLMVQRRTVTIAQMTLMAAGTNVVLNYLLIPRWQATGAAWATLASEGILFFLTWWAARGARVESMRADAADTLDAGA